jgi:hypothetical protein
MDPKPPTDMTVHVLIEIRDEIRKTNKRVDVLTARVDHLSEKVDSNFEVQNAHITESEIRVATAIVDLAGTVNDIKTILVDRLDLRDRVERCERDIDELKRARG